jgi:hypothetical protein
MEEQEFNHHCLLLDGYKMFPCDQTIGYEKEGCESVVDWDEGWQPDYYNDLNLLMPLVFKYVADISFRTQCMVFKKGSDITYSDKDPIQAIRLCIKQIGVSHE